ncbi:TadE/TadG family type IV pilus assembly protein [Achromobacter sp. UMC46]|uniref:TadE/TadG family type IV pilus assembly protein n=1 Tax=Achromobacter sp. UMC46 TaxID=1862319 RepID=UPI0016012DDB|nr:TadE/TadG family type IV pilus assembly protein [Achromobacter sp. UMC46]MBB1597688.1 pilus assembly protein TadE [Achromobacter sp. UMC46]
MKAHGGSGRGLASQQGQAVVEALLLLPLMAMMVWAVSGIGNLQFSAQQMSQASRKAAMAGALGQPLEPAWSSASSALKSQATALSGIASPRVRVLQDEWFGVGLRWLSVQARTAPVRHDALLAPSIVRQTRVAIGAGYAHGDADARRRIAGAPTAWRQAERASLAQARRVGAIAQRMDGPWGRAAVSMDWLSPWADLAPADRLGKRGGLIR